MVYPSARLLNTVRKHCCKTGSKDSQIKKHKYMGDMDMVDPITIALLQDIELADGSADVMYRDEVTLSRFTYANLLALCKLHLPALRFITDDGSIVISKVHTSSSDEYDSQDHGSLHSQLVQSDADVADIDDGDAVYVHVHVVQQQGQQQLKQQGHSSCDMGGVHSTSTCTTYGFGCDEKVLTLDGAEMGCNGNGKTTSDGFGREDTDMEIEDC